MANRKRMRFLDIYGCFSSVLKFCRIVKADSLMYPAAESEVKVVDKEPLSVTDNYLFMTAFIRVCFRYGMHEFRCDIVIYRCFFNSKSHKN